MNKNERLFETWIKSIINQNVAKMLDMAEGSMRIEDENTGVYTNEIESDEWVIDYKVTETYQTVAGDYLTPDYFDVLQTNIEGYIQLFTKDREINFNGTVAHRVVIDNNRARTEWFLKNLTLSE